MTQCYLKYVSLSSRVGLDLSIQSSNLSTLEDWNLVSKTTVWFWVSRIIVPQPGREKILNLLHEGHPGICKMKALARNFIWWPKIDVVLEGKVKQCNQCQLSRLSSPVVPMHPWDWPEYPWQQIHLDYAGPINGKMFLILIDAHSKWMEVEIVNFATSQATIVRLRAIFLDLGCQKWWLLTMGHVSPVVNSKSLHNIIASDMYVLLLTIHL